ncbi:helix-turn-helix domain-containing protein [Paenibacillus provencensis]|uniref:Helix-turn-helix domain-containing protein n=1 Tax=Paenibacillus provencensis TaxID=441151 RepID=A0ABW3PZG9_9BACL|nr:AraC family transcriptional regulator [Paenibacillus sp. MER 78]MCM3128570.1 AraC family transcriptional regulator [Paenibacillus sp. MER 78]
MTTNPHKENTWIPDRTFPINVFFVNDIYLHWHDHLEWVYVKKGRVRLQIDGDFDILEQGDLAFVHSKQLHRAEQLEPDTQLVCIVFNEALVRGNGLDITEHHYFLPYLHLKHQWPRIVRNQESCMQPISLSFLRLIEEFENKQPGYELIVKSELLHIFGRYFRHAQQEGSQIRMFHQRDTHNLSSLLELLREHYRDDISVTEAARQVNLSPNYFCSVFKKMTGKTLKEYVHTLRIQEAELLLLTTDYRVSEIAEAVGFSNLTYFGRIFKKIKNIPPSDVRKMKSV